MLLIVDLMIILVPVAPASATISSEQWNPNWEKIGLALNETSG